MKKFNKFAFIEGNNSARYYFRIHNSSLFDDIKNLYSPVGFKYDLIRLYLYLSIVLLNLIKDINFLRGYKILDKNKVICSIGLEQQVVKLLADFDLRAVFVSGNHNKIIAVLEDGDFIKFGIGDSYSSVEKEYHTYELINKDNVDSFKVSTATALYDNNKDCFAFRMSGNKTYRNKVGIDDLKKIIVPAAKFFTLTHTCNSTDLKKVLSDLALFANDVNCSSKVLNSIQLLASCNSFTTSRVPLGLVHNDFKHYNMRKNENGKIKFYDFEETSSTGLPFFDVFNFITEYYIEKENYEAVAKIISSHHLTIQWQIYSNTVGFDSNIDLVKYYNLFLIERLIYWSDVNIVQSLRYDKLIDKITNINNNSNSLS